MSYLSLGAKEIYYCILVIYLAVICTSRAQQAARMQQDHPKGGQASQQLLRPVQASRRDTSVNSNVYFKAHNYPQAESSKSTQPLAWNKPPVPSELLLQDRTQQFEALRRESLADQAADGNLAPLDLASINARSGKSSLQNKYQQPVPVKQPNPWLLQGPFTRAEHYKHKLIDLTTQNCITRSTPRAWSCEDHLIKRLHQDADEGRTVIDVGRRVCCALFWHKDCINRIVLEACPDSSPAAADFLMGSRKVDLTLSCQRFNRDGCNASPRTVSCSLMLGSIVLVTNLIAWSKTHYLVHNLVNKT